MEGIIDDLFHIEGIIYDLIERYGSQADGLEKDATLVISTVQELRFSVEEKLDV